MLAKGDSDFGEMVARCTVQMHVTGGPERMGGSRSKIAVFRPKLFWQETGRARFVAQAHSFVGVGAGPRVAAEAAHDRRCQAKTHSHYSKRHGQDLACSAIGQSG